MKSAIVLSLVIFLLVGCSDEPSGPDAEDSDVLLLEDAHFPSWSPDGSGIICNRAVPGLEHCAWWITVSGTESDTLLADADCQYGPSFPKWIPGGRNIVYHRTREGIPSSIDEIVIHDLDGGNPVVWESPGLWDDAAFTLVPDGSEVLYTFYQEGHKIQALDLSNGTTRIVCGGECAAVSPDCQWIAFSKDDIITVAPFDGGEEVSFESGWWAAWTPDSQYIIFTGFGSSGDIDLIIVSRDGLYRSQLTDDPEYDLCPAVSPQGDRVVYVKTPDDDYGPFNLRLLKLELD